MDSAHSGNGKIGVDTDDPDVVPLDSQITLLTVGRLQPTTAIEGAEPSLSALWDTVVKFDEGDAVTIWGPQFNVTFVSNHVVASGSGVTLCATAPGDVNASVTFAGRSIAGLSDSSRLTFDADSNGGDAGNFNRLSEPQTRYYIVNRPVSRVVVPLGTSLTPRVLLAALRKMPTVDIEDAIEALITELDIRNGDADDEPDADGESDPEEAAA